MLNEWSMDTELLKKYYIKSNNNEFFLSIVYERLLLNDIDALNFCYWLYDKNS